MPATDTQPCFQSRYIQIQSIVGKAGIWTQWRLSAAMSFDFCLSASDFFFFSINEPDIICHEISFLLLV